MIMDCIESAANPNEESDIARLMHMGMYPQHLIPLPSLI
jgi:hypothetical protein